MAMSKVKGSKFRVQGLGFRVRGSKFKVQRFKVFWLKRLRSSNIRRIELCGIFDLNNFEL
jgi:hypothetical protein